MANHDLTSGGIRVGLWRSVVGEETPTCSAEWREIFGLGPEEPPMRLADMPVLFEDWAHVLELSKDRLEGYDTPSVEVWAKRQSDGARRRVRISSSAERNELGETIATYGVVVDLTDLSEAWAQARANEQLLSAFVAHAPASLAMFDSEMRYMRVSRRWIADFGLEGQSLIGRNHYDVFPEIGQAWKDVHQRCLRGAVERNDRDLFLREDGRRQWVSWEVRPWRDSHGEIGGILMLTRDVSELVASIEAVERSERRLQLALNASGDTVWQYDARTGELTCAGERDFATETEPLQAIAALAHPEDRGFLRDAIAEALRTGEVTRVEHRMMSPAHTEKWALSVIEPMRDDSGAAYGVIGLLKDITDQKAEQRILAEARRVAEAASRAKSDFLATMSHEIRTPLNGVMGVAQALARTPLNERQREMVDLLLSAGRSLKGLVDDTLEVGRIEAGVIVLAQENFDVTASVRDSATLYAAAAAEKGLAFECVTCSGDGVQAVGDPLRLRQIITNLVGNAIKFTKSGIIRVEIEALPQPGGKVALNVWVRDTGVGFDEATKARIFDRFVQGHHGPRSGGVGLGLAIARSLAQAMQGEIECESAPHQGSTFTFSCMLPAAKDGAGLAAAHSDFEHQGHVMVEILVAEDHPLNQKILQLLLEQFAARLTFVGDGLAACEAAERGSFDLILMDMQMPLLDGLTATRLIRAREAIAGKGRIPIISLTAQASAEQIRAALLAGADAHVSKPIEKSALFAAIETALAGPQKRAQG